MAQIFSPRSDTVFRVVLGSVLLLLGGAAWVASAVFWSPYTTEVGIPKEQPVPFSHKHHVAGLSIDCRYCHTSVETSPYAGMPSTEICMTCHSQLWTQASLLEPIRQSFARHIPVQWTRVNDLPDFVYFDHSIHVAKGVGCATCHGQVDQMPLTWKANTLYMKWCLECHRAPENQLRPRGEVFNMELEKPGQQREEGLALLLKNHVDTTRLTDCSTCHR